MGMPRHTCDWSGWQIPLAHLTCSTLMQALMKGDAHDAQRACDSGYLH
jgi:hypothetical protein